MPQDRTESSSPQGGNAPASVGREVAQRTAGPLDALAGEREAFADRSRTSSIVSSLGPTEYVLEAQAEALQALLEGIWSRIAEARPRGQMRLSRALPRWIAGALRSSPALDFLDLGEPYAGGQGAPVARASPDSTAGAVETSSASELVAGDDAALATPVELRRGEDTQAATALAGSPPEVRLQLSALLRRSGHDLGRLRGLLSGTLLATLERMQRAGVSRVGLADTVLVVLNDLPPTLLPFVEALVPRLRDLIESEREPTANWCKTAGALADVLKGTQRDGGLYCANYYEELLGYILEQWRPAPPSAEAVEPGLWEVIEADSNNVAVRIGRSARDEHDAVDTKVGVVLRHCVAISAAARFAQADLAGADEHEALLAVPVWGDLARQGVVGPKRPLRHVFEVLDNMLTVSPALGVAERSLDMAYLEALGGVARAASRKANRAASTFFNAGVTLLRLAGGKKPARLAQVRTLVNGLGLCWSLRLYPGDLGAALAQGNGLECLVNLFGAATDVTPLVGDLRAVTLELADIGWRALNETGLLERNPATPERLRRSWQQLGFTPKPVRRATANVAQRLSDTGEALVEAVARTLDLGAVLETAPGEPLRTARLVAAAFETCLTSAGEADALRTQVVEQIATFARGLTEPVSTFLQLYGELHEQGGPVLASGVMSAAEWTRVRQASRLPCASAVQAVRESLAALDEATTMALTAAPIATQSPHEVALALASQGRSLRSQPAAFAQFLAGPVSDTLTALESRGAAHLELSDALVTLLHELPAPLHPLLDSVVPCLRSYIEVERTRDPRWYKALGSLGDVLRHSERERGLFGLQYYEEILAEVLAAWQARLPAAGTVDSDLWEVLSTDSNNLAARIARAQRLHGASTSPATASTMRRCIEISVSASLASQPAQVEATPSALAAIETWVLLANASSGLGQALEVLDRMVMVPGALLQWAQDEAWPYLLAWSGVARVALQRRDRAAAAFFNAAGNLMRAESRRTATPWRLVALLQAQGARWALHLHEDDIENALLTGDGLDCINGLVVALLRIEPRPAALHERLVDLVRAALGAVQAAGGVLRVPAALLLLQSAEKLKVTPDARAARERAWPQLADAVDALNEALVADLARTPSTTDEALEDTAGLVEDAFLAWFFGNDEAQRSRVRQQAIGYVTEMTVCTQDPVRTFVDNYAALAALGGPVLAAGLVDRTAWEQAQRSGQQPCDALGPALRAAVHAFATSEGAPAPSV